MAACSRQGHLRVALSFLGDDLLRDRSGFRREMYYPATSQIELEALFGCSKGVMGAKSDALARAKKPVLSVEIKPSATRRDQAGLAIAMRALVFIAWPLG